eukprot:350982_1
MSYKYGVRSFINVAKPSIIVDINQVANKWNKMSKWYSGLLNHFMSPTTASLIPHLQLHLDTNNNDTFKLLDVAIGDGYNSTYIIKHLIENKSSFEYHGNDIAHEMIDIANQTIQNDILISNMLQQNSNKYKIDISVQNSEDLAQYKNDSFDRYLSSLCLMITGNAINMLQESYRVLKPNGICAFSIWGDKNKCTFFQVMDVIFKEINDELGMEQVEERSNYYLADDFKYTIEMFKSVGFSKIYHWNMDVAIPLISLQQWCDYYLVSPHFHRFLNQCKTDEEKEKITKILIHRLEKYYTEYFVQRHTALTHNNICIIASK